MTSQDAPLSALQTPVFHPFVGLSQQPVPLLNHQAAASPFWYPAPQVAAPRVPMPQGYLHPLVPPPPAAGLPANFSPYNQYPIPWQPPQIPAFVDVPYIAPTTSRVLNVNAQRFIPASTSSSSSSSSGSNSSAEPVHSSFSQTVSPSAEELPDSDVDDTDNAAISTDANVRFDAPISYSQALMSAHAAKMPVASQQSKGDFEIPGSISPSSMYSTSPSENSEAKDLPNFPEDAKDESIESSSNLDDNPFESSSVSDEQTIDAQTHEIDDKNESSYPIEDSVSSLHLDVPTDPSSTQSSRDRDGSQIENSEVSRFSPDQRSSTLAIAVATTDAAPATATATAADDDTTPKSPRQRVVSSPSSLSVTSHPSADAEKRKSRAARRRRRAKRLEQHQQQALLQPYSTSKFVEPKSRSPTAKVLKIKNSPPSPTDSPNVLLDKAPSVSLSLPESKSSPSPPSSATELVESKNDTFLHENFQLDSNDDFSRSNHGRLPKNAEVFEGTCVWFDAERGYGFIQSDSHPDDIFVHHWALASPISKDTIVSFMLSQTNGRACARRVFPLRPRVAHPKDVRPRHTSPRDDVSPRDDADHDTATTNKLPFPVPSDDDVVPPSESSSVSANSAAVLRPNLALSTNSTYAQIARR